MELYKHQKVAVRRLRNGSVLVGDTGSGKSLTALYYFYCNVCGGEFSPWKERTNKMKLYIITTAKKRDGKDWEEELFPFLMKDDEYVVDSWNNIQKYVGVSDAFFIFDEQRLVSQGTWSKSFLKIVKCNKWILLSATPGDTWSDYLSLFIAHGFVKNKTEFSNKYCVYSRFSKFPKIERYVCEEDLRRWRNIILVPMKDLRTTEQIHTNVYTEFNRELYLKASKERWNVFEEHPSKDMGEVCRVLRKIVNMSDDKISKLADIKMKHNRLIIFYNFNYELEELINFCETWSIPYSQWNGHKHEQIPDTFQWAYLVQYSAGCEGWNCISTDSIVFFSPNYSYKVMKQAAGRIDRINTKFKKLYYYHILSKSSIDKAITDAVNNKRDFNESEFERSDIFEGKERKARSSNKPSPYKDSGDWGSIFELSGSGCGYRRQQRGDLQHNARARTSA